MASNNGVIEFLKPLFFFSLIKGALINSNKEYDVYLGECTDVNKSRSNDSKIFIASNRDSMYEQMLNALIEMKKIDGAWTVEQASYKKVKA